MKVLLNRNLHLLAMKIGTYLGMKIDSVLIHWACQKIKKYEGNANIVQLIVDKLKDVPALSYAEIAKTAFRAGQSKLAISLLDYEPRATEQIPLLLSMQEDDVALIKAIQSGNVDLAILVLIHLKKKYPLADFFRIIRDKPQVIPFMEIYCKEVDHDLLKSYYYQADMYFDHFLFDLLHQSDSQSFSEVIKLISNRKDRIAELKYCEDEMKLNEFKVNLSNETGIEYTELSLYELLFKCFMEGNVTKANRLKSDFKISDKRYFYQLIKVFIYSHQSIDCF